MKAPCHHSEDRALTSSILKSGYISDYQRSAVVYTMVPETYAGVCRMTSLGGATFGNPASCWGTCSPATGGSTVSCPSSSVSLTQMEGPRPVCSPGRGCSPCRSISPSSINCSMRLGVGSFFGLLYYLWLERDLEFVYRVLYSFYAFFLLQWILPYAFFTVRDRRWLTR